MALSTEVALCFEFQGENYSLLEIPSNSSKIVVQSKEKMMGRINLQGMAKDFSNLAKFLRLAYNGVVGHVELQTKVKTLFYDTVRLCDESVHTMNEFSRASHTAVESLLATYEFLMDGFDDMAITNLQEISEVAKRMSAAAQNLATEFSKEAQACQVLQKETTKASAAAKQRGEDKLKEKNQTQIDKEIEERLYKDMTEDEQRARKEYEESRSQQLKEIGKQKLGFFKGFMNAFTESTFGKGIYEDEREAAIKAADLHQMEMEKFEKQMLDAKDKRREALQQMARFAKAIEQMGEEVLLEEAAADSLHHAATALTNLADIMQIAANFWKETHSTCQDLSSDKVTKYIKNIAKLDDKKREEALNKKTFVKAGIKYYSEWIAIKNICDEFHGEVTAAQNEIHSYIRENPTQSQARATVKVLAPSLNAIITKSIDDIDQQTKALAITD